jgi:lipopolysaccharide export system protein LptA
MKNVWLVLLMTVTFALRAQTNAPPEPPAVPPAADSTNTPAASVAGTVEKASAPRVRPPTQIRSDSGEFLLASNIYIYRGNVIVDDPQMKLSCDLLTVEAPKLVHGKFNQAIANGNVVIHFLDEHGQTNHAFAAKAVYTYSITNAATNAFIVLTGPPDPVLSTDDGGRLTGETIEFNRLTGRVTTKNSTTTIPRAGSSDLPDFFGGPGASRTNAPKPRPSGGAKP